MKNSFMNVIRQWATTPPRYEATSASARSDLLPCSLCASPDRREDDIYGLRPNPLLRQCHTVYDEQLKQYQTTTYLKQHLLPKLPQLVLCPENHQICLENWNSSQLEALSTVLRPSDSSDSITAVLLDVSRTLVKRVDTLGDVRIQAKFIEVVVNNAFSGSTSAAPPVRSKTLLRSSTWVYTSWNVVKPHTLGISNDFTRFKTRQKAE